MFRVAGYQEVDMDTFDRRMYYEYFMEVGTTLDVTTKIDVTTALTTCREKKLSFYGYTIYCLGEVVNKIENMRYDLVDGKLVLWDELVPSFTSFNDVTKRFHALWMKQEMNEKACDKEFKQLVARYKDSNHISPMRNVPRNLFNVSSVPWLPFDSMSANNRHSSTTLLPIITTGKYQAADNQVTMPVNVKCHHATMDGYHIALFFERLQIELNKKR